MKKIAYLSIYFLSPVLLMTAILSTNLDKYSNPQYFFPMAIGVFAYTGLLWQFVISARPKPVEKTFGLDRMLRFHGMAAIVLILGGLLHKTLNEQLFSESSMTQIGEIGLNIFIGISVLSIILMGDRLLKKIPVFRDTISIIEKKRIIPYEKLKWIHNITWIGMVFLQVHVLLTYSAQNSLLAFSTYMIYFAIGLGAYLYHKAYRPWLLANKRYVISEVIQESQDMISLRLQPEKGKMMKYAPGQFGFFTILSPEIPSEAHPFSFSSSPNDAQGISVTIKRLGDFTERIGGVKIGDPVMIDGPYGKFSYTNYENERDTVFFAGGVGITPVLSMIKHMSEENRERRVTLVWGVRTAADIIQKEEIERIEKEMPNFRCIPVVSADGNWKGKKGNLDRSMIEGILAEAQIENPHTGFYVCGPPPMIESVNKNLQQIGIPKSKIHYELFAL